MELVSKVTITVVCQTCSKQVPLSVSFKYGNLWRHKYRIGDELVWCQVSEWKPWMKIEAMKNVGDPKAEHVVVEGIAENCPECGKSAVPNENYLVTIQNSIIMQVKSKVE